MPLNTLFHHTGNGSSDHSFLIVTLSIALMATLLGIPALMLKLPAIHPQQVQTLSRNHEESLPRTVTDD